MLKGGTRTQVFFFWVAVENRFPGEVWDSIDLLGARLLSS